MDDIGPGAYVTDGLAPSCQKIGLFGDFLSIFIAYIRDPLLYGMEDGSTSELMNLIFCELMGGTGYAWYTCVYYDACLFYVDDGTT